jgi:hypothetical protein
MPLDGLVSGHYHIILPIDYVDETALVQSGEVAGMHPPAAPGFRR